MVTSQQWTKLKFTDKLFDKNIVKKRKKVRKQLLKLFPSFQQFKVEIRNISEWAMDWNTLT